MCKSSLEVEQMTAALYTYVWHASLCDFNWNLTGSGWMGNAAKGGMEIYTPVHIVCMCYVSCM